MSGLFIAWAPHNRRSQQIAEALGLQLHFIHRGQYRAPIYAPFKYPLMALETWRLLNRAKPKVVFTQSPPPLLPLVVLLYGFFWPVQLVIDHHTAAFSGAWAWLGPLRAWMARRAAFNLITNEHWQERIERWGGQALVLDDVPADFPMGEAYALPTGANVVVISSIAPDEPLELVLEAARQQPDKRRVPENLLRAAPANLQFTGFLSDAQYFGLLRAVDALVVLTTRDFTNQRGGCEAVWLGQPLVISNWPVLQRAFHRGAVHVPNTVEGIVGGIQEALTRRAELLKGMAQLQTERRAHWQAVSGQLHRLLQATS